MDFCYPYRFDARLSLYATYREVLNCQLSAIPVHGFVMDPETGAIEVIVENYREV
jgi:hypothetical protein